MSLDIFVPMSGNYYPGSTMVEKSLSHLLSEQGGTIEGSSSKKVLSVKS